MSDAKHISFPTTELCLKLLTNQILTLSFILTKSPQFGLCKTKKCSAPRIVEKSITAHFDPCSENIHDLRDFWSSCSPLWNGLSQQKSWSAQTSKTDDAPVRASSRGSTLNSADLRQGYRMHVLVWVSHWVSHCVTKADPEFMILLSQPSKNQDHTPSLWMHVKESTLGAFYSIVALKFYQENCIIC